MRASVERRRDTGFSCRPATARHGGGRVGEADFELGRWSPSRHRSRASDLVAPAMFDFSIMRARKSPSTPLPFALWQHTHAQSHRFIINFHPSAPGQRGGETIRALCGAISAPTTYAHTGIVTLSDGLNHRR